MKRKKARRRHRKKKKMKSVRTPIDIDISIGYDESLKDISSKLNHEISSEKCWTDECTRLLQTNGHALFLYDRTEYSIAKAYGSNSHKILLNPVMIMCYHPDCMKSQRTIRLKTAFDISRYLEHLLDHDDEIGAAMLNRFGTVVQYPFMTEEDLNKIDSSPHSLQSDVRPSKKTKKVIKSYGIDRKLKSSYICHWKDVLLRQKIINSSSLTFQEDDALIYTVLHYPNPVKDWGIYDTLAFYCLKFVAGVGESGLNLYRGTTHLRINEKKKTDFGDMCKFVADINHPGPSLTTLQHVLPKLIHENKTRHIKEIIFHLKLLEKTETSSVVEFPLVKRYPATLGIDEQELNSGVYIHDGKLHGLKEPMTPEKISEVGLKNLAKYIAEENHFINAAREYRLTDIKGIFCSNVFTWFLSEVLLSHQVIENLKNVVIQASNCVNCLKNNLKCVYEHLDQQCTECAKLGLCCTSMFVLVVLWDMGSSHKKTAKEMPSLTSNSPLSDFNRRSMFSFIFGGLHLCKACVNCSRNHVLTYDGSNYGVYLLRQLKHQFVELFQGIKTAVLVGKDRQSDLLSFLTCGEEVQEILKQLKTYEVIRIPEDILSYTAKAKTQQRMITPISIAVNRNGDVFVLDSGGACIHVLDRSSVAKVIILGKYKSSSLGEYGKKKKQGDAFKAKDILLSTGVTDMIIHDDNVIIADGARGEVAIIRKCTAAAAVNSRSLHIMKVEACISMSVVDQNLVVLRKDSENYLNTIEVLSLPKFKGTKLSLFVSHTVLVSLRSDVPLKSLFSLSMNRFGAHTEDKKIQVFSLTDGHVSIVKFESSSKCRPSFCNQSNQILTVESSSSNILSRSLLKLDGSDGCSLEESDDCTQCNYCPLFLCSWGRTVYMICCRGINDFILVEMGSLDFGIEFCESISKLYRAVSYVPPRGDSSCRSMKLSECIDLATEGADLFNKIQASLQERFSGRTDFYGANGAIWTQTLNSMNLSVDSLNAVQNRLKHFFGCVDPDIYCHTLFNESYVEHSFGHQNQKTQGQLPNKQEYCQSKRRQQANFQITMCNTPFNQYSKVKKRDQGYQAVGDRDIDLSIRDMKEIFDKFDDDNKQVENKKTSDDDDTKILNYAFNMAKAVPRQSNRTKWREKSGFMPNMLLQSDSNAGKLFAGDLVFFKSLDNRLLNLLVAENVTLIDINMSVKVKILQNDEANRVYTIQLSQLLQDGGRTVVIPSTLFKLEDGELKLDENVSSYILDGIRDQEPVSRTDSDWASFLDSFCEIAGVVSEHKAKTKNSRVKRKLPISSKASKKKDFPKKKGTAKKGATKKPSAIKQGNYLLAEVAIDGVGEQDDDGGELDVTARSKKRKRTIVYSDEEDEDSNLDLNKRIISVGSYVKIVSGRYTNFFASVKSKYGKLWNVEYFQPKFGKWSRKDGDNDSRYPHELIVVCGAEDRRGCFIFTDISND